MNWIPDDIDWPFSFRFAYALGDEEDHETTRWKVANDLTLDDARIAAEWITDERHKRGFAFVIHNFYGRLMADGMSLGEAIVDLSASSVNASQSKN